MIYGRCKLGKAACAAFQAATKTERVTAVTRSATNILVRNLPTVLGNFFRATPVPRLRASTDRPSKNIAQIRLVPSTFDMLSLNATIAAVKTSMYGSIVTESGITYKINKDTNPKSEKSIPLILIHVASLFRSLDRLLVYPYASAMANPPKVNVSKGARKRGKWVSRISARIHVSVATMSVIGGYLIGILTLAVFEQIEQTNLLLASVLGFGGLTLSFMCFRKADYL